MRPRASIAIGRVNFMFFMKYQRLVVFFEVKNDDLHAAHPKPLFRVHYDPFAYDSIGGEGGTRTPDPVIMSHVL